MHTYSRKMTYGFAAATALALLFSAAILQAQTPANNSTVPVTTTVTVLGPKGTAPPPITKEDVIATSGKMRLTVLNWVPSQEQGRLSGLQLAIVIDNAISAQQLGRQFNDIKQFIAAQPRSTAVGVFYAMNGTVQIAAPFSTDHAAVAKKVRLTPGRFGGESPSIYLSLKDLVAKWPQSPGRREVLLIASGSDPLNPGLIDPYFDAAVESVQKANIVVHTIYAGNGRFATSFRGGNAQSKLEELTQESGGQAFFEGLSAPVSFAPYLDELDNVLRNQYQLTVAMPATDKKNGELRPLKITTEDRNAVISAPAQVLVPGLKK